MSVFAGTYICFFLRRFVGRNLLSGFSMISGLLVWNLDSLALGGLLDNVSLPHLLICFRFCRSR